MDLKSNHAAPILTDPAPMSKSRLGLYSGLFPYSPPGAVFSSGMYLAVPRKKPIPGKLEDVRSSGWLDAMKSSSPPRKKMTKDFIVEVPSDDNGDLLYRPGCVHFLTEPVFCSFLFENVYRIVFPTVNFTVVVQLKYPSALSSFEQITNQAKGKKIALFLDYDGTLSPIVDDPERALMSKTMRYAVRNVAKYFPTAIISGRSRDKVYEFVGLTELHYAGSHGMDIMGPVRNSEFIDDLQNCIRSTDKQGKEVNLFQPASEYLPMIDEVFKSLIEITKDIKGSKVENNKFCVSVHYRNVDEKHWSTIGQCVQDLLKDYPRLRVTHGRKVLEVRPDIKWDKGKAVEFLLDSLGLSERDDVLPIYVGDDRTDEDALKSCVRGIKVSES
ncbi:hypothetical protein GIB67_018963 [Kingdonia uniflora]|uniref:Trehalose 6-phosphate phosphatase n=1 Tax=Kingdonia uniflora TaxID=39325 RepID=A0A7J7M8P0_9MAGN|nr:hypothetical protein GIB67_018963 [Kingdonia uniflora]